jgi:hypothetical protein
LELQSSEGKGVAGEGWGIDKIALFPDLFVRAEIKMLTYSHICSAFYFHPASTSEKIANFEERL